MGARTNRLTPTLPAALVVLGALTSAPLASAAGADLWIHSADAASSLLPVDQAFALVSAERRSNTIQISWAIAPGYYLYRKRLAFDLPAPGAAKSFDSPRLPAGAIIHDEHEGDAEIYRGMLVATLPLHAGAPVPQKLKVRYQGCAEAGVCYPPQTRIVDILTP